MPGHDGIPPVVVRDTVRAIVEDVAYYRSIQSSVFDRLWRWFFELVGRMFDAVGQAASFGRPIAVVALGVIVLLILGRIAYASRLGLDELELVPGGRTRGRAITLADADRLAAERAYLDAVHALHRIVLEALARRDGLHLHSSKTSGDYLRELRRRGSSAQQPFRQFSRRHDRVVFGLGACDLRDWELVRADAERVLRMERAA